MQAPNIELGDFRMPGVAPLVSPTFRLPNKEPYRAAYNPLKPDPVQYADTKAQTLLNFGRALGGAADVATDITMRVQLQANALVTDAAVNKAKETALRLAYDKENGFTSLKGYDALNRPDGKPLADEFASKFDEAVKTLSGDLKNDAQRRAFAAQALTIRANLYGRAVTHETQEFRNYNLSVQEGTIKTEIDNIGLNYKNPDMVGQSVERLKGAVAEQGMALGKSVQWFEAAQKDAVSKAHSTALASAMEEGNVVFADAYMTAHKGEMNADDILRVRGVITKEMDGRVGLASARDAVATIAPRFEPTDYDRLNRIVIGQESRGREYNPDGSRVTSPKGARGIQQVMPKTADKPGYGIKPSNGTPADDARLGREYLGAMVKLRNGDVALALASYNAGPGRVDEAMAKAQDPKNKGKSWLDFVPAETQAYVKNGLAAYGSGGGRPATPTLEDAMAALDKDPRVNSSPSRLAIARQEVRARFTEMTQAAKTREDDAMSTAFQMLMANGGDFASLPVSIKSTLGDKVDTVMTFADKIRGGNTVTNPAVYQKLTDERYLRGLSEAEFFHTRGELSDGDFQHFADIRSKAPGAGQGVGDLNAPAVKMVTDNWLATLNIPTTGKAADPNRLGVINRTIRQELLVAQRAAGKKFDDAETEAFVDRLFKKDMHFRSVTLGIANDTHQRLLTMTFGDIPDNDVGRVKKLLIAGGVPVPTQGDILQAYMRIKLRENQ